MRHATLALCGLLLACGEAAYDDLDGVGQQITYGTIDSENRYASTGAMLALYNGARRVHCSGTLIAKDVFLTAAHCKTDGPFWVSFSKNIYAADAVHLKGTFIAHPDYQMATANDVAVIRLERAVNLRPVRLPTEGYLDVLKAKGALADSKFMAVGYGRVERTDGPQPTHPLTDGWRRYAASTYISQNGAVLNLNQQQHQGNGGSCYGDSGGPNFLGTGDLQLSTTITGDSPCENTGVTLRLDTPHVRAFLGTYVALP